VVYTDVWLWDKSGRFQLDTLTEGQLSVLPAAVPTPPQPPQQRRTAPANRVPVKPVASRGPAP